MAKRFGSVRTLPSGRHQASYWHEGRRHIGPDTFRTKSDAWAYLSGIETSIRRGGWVDPLAGAVTLRVYASAWLADRPNLRPRTVDKYRYLLEHNILPLLGDKTMTDLSPAAVRTWHARLSADRPTTGAAAYRLLRSICRTAIADELIARNPCQVRGGGSEHSPERPLVSIAEVEALAEAMPERLRALVLLASWCGLRRGEGLGLQRRDVDVARGTVHIERAVVHMLDGTMTIGPPKSEAGTRTVYYPSNIAPAIEEHLMRHVGDGPSSWLFAGTIGNPLAVKTLQRAWNGAQHRTSGRPVARPAPRRSHLGGRLRGYDQGAHVPAGARHPCRCSALPARHRRAGQGPRRRPGRARRLGQGGPDRRTPLAPN